MVSRISSSPKLCSAAMASARSASTRTASGLTTPTTNLTTSPPVRVASTPSRPGPLTAPRSWSPSSWWERMMRRWSPVIPARRSTRRTLPSRCGCSTRAPIGCSPRLASWRRLTLTVKTTGSKLRKTPRATTATASSASMRMGRGLTPRTPISTSLNRASSTPTASRSTRLMARRSKSRSGSSAAMTGRSSTVSLTWCWTSKSTPAHPVS